MSLTLDQVVSITILTSPTPPAVPGFGAAMFLGKSTTLPLESRVLVATQQADVSAAGFATTTEEYLAAGIYFGQSPRPTGPFKVGRQFLTAQAGKLVTGGVSTTMSDYTGITTGSFDVVINGVNRQITGVNFTGVVDLNAAAAILQTRLQVALASTLCVASGGKFIITSPTTGAASTVGFLAAPTGGGVDITALLKGTSVLGARPVTGVAVETITDALVATRLLDPGWYGLGIPVAATLQENKDCMAHAQSTKYKFWCSTNDVTAYDPNVSADLASYAKTNAYDHTFVIYSASPYAAISAMAREQVTDITQPSSFGTLMFKQLPGISYDNLTATQVNALRGKNCNYYIQRGTFAELETGVMANGQFSDEVFGLDAFSATYQNAIFTAMATTPTKIPQTDKGGTMLLAAGRVACEQFVRNGFFAPGKWLSSTVVGVVTNGDFLKAGYVQAIGDVADQSATDRALRKTPPITICGKGAGAFHSSAITFVFDR